MATTKGGAVFAFHKGSALTAESLGTGALDASHAGPSEPMRPSDLTEKRGVSPSTYRKSKQADQQEVNQTHTMKSQAIMMGALALAGSSAAEMPTEKTYHIHPPSGGYGYGPHPQPEIFIEKSRLTNTPAKNQHQKRKNARRAFAAGDRRAFCK